MFPVDPSPEARRFVTKAEYVYTRLLQDIVTLRQPADSTLRIDELAREYGVSPIPIREALARLTAERFVVTRPHVGPQVARVDETALHDVFALLAGLESAAAARVVANATAADVEAVEAQLRVIDGAADAEAWAAANTAFHLRIAALARMPLVDDALRLGFTHWGRIRRHFFRQVEAGRQDVAEDEHHAIVDLLHKRDAAGLEAALREHNRGALRAYMALLPS